MLNKPKMKKWKFDYKWELILMLWFAFFLNQGDRQVYGAIVEDIQTALGLNGVQAGWVVTVFTVVYGCLAPFGGYVGDFLRRKWIVIISLIVFSLGTLFTGFAGAMGAGVGAFIYLIIMRGVATGAGEAFYNPAAISLITQHHEKTRGTAISLHQSALYVGILVSAVVAPLISKAWGWQYAFIGFGVFGLLVALYCIFRMEDTPQISAQTERIPFKELLVGIFSKKTIWLLALAFGCQVFVNIGITTWAAKYFNLQFYGGENLPMASSVAMLTSCGFAILGVMIGGRFSDKMAQKSKLARMRTEYIGLLGGAPFLLMIGFTDNIWIAAAAMSVYGIFRGIYDSNIYAAMFDVIDPKLRASSVGILTAFAFIVGCLAPVYLGAVQGDDKANKANVVQEVVTSNESGDNAQCDSLKLVAEVPTQNVEAVASDTTHNEVSVDEGAAQAKGCDTVVDKTEPVAEAEATSEKRELTEAEKESLKRFGWGISSMGIFFLVGGLLIAAAAKFTFLKERYEE